MTPASVSICIGSRVELTGKNLNPAWGLFNGSMGIVVDIVFEDNKTPNNGDLPQYVLVNFPLYRGPPFNPKHKTWVPITPVFCHCQKSNGCCKRLFLPLKLAFGKTIHTCQGLSIGPVQPGQPPNAIQSIICDPGTRTFEGSCPGLFYTLLSRVTTLGVPSDLTTSSIYFKGNNMNPKRIQNITLKENGTPYIGVTKRRQWVNYLNSHAHKGLLTIQEKKDILSWATTTQFTLNALDSMIDKHVHQAK